MDFSLLLQSPIVREQLGKIVRAEWVAFAKEREKLTGCPAPAHHLTAWDELDEVNKEVDRRIGIAVVLEYARLAQSGILG